MVNSICEECKNLITDFYVFKNTAKQNLQISKAFAYLKEFLDSNQSDPVVRITQNQFIVSFEDTDEYPDEDDGIVEEIEEEVYEQDEPMRIEEDQVSYSYDVDAAHASSSEDGFTDQEFENEVKPTRPAERLKCDCGEILFSAQELALHLNQHKSKSGKTKLSCQEKTCNIDFKDPKYMEMHEKAHENFKAVAPHLPSFICTHCRSMFAVEDDYITHIAYHQVDGELNHQYLIERRSAYDDHMLRSIKSSELEDETDVEELYSCGYCDKKTIEFDMKIHLLFFHTHIVSCPFDNRVFDGFKQVRLFSEHVRNKHPEIFEKSDLFTCRHCNSSFESHFEKLAHMKQCEGKLFACEGHCDKRFATDWLRKLHMRQVQGIDRFSCEICKKVCVSKSDLQIHNRSHTNERPYECPICLKCFKTSANRSSHMDIHEPGKRHACDICGENFLSIVEICF